MRQHHHDHDHHHGPGHNHEADSQHLHSHVLGNGAAALAGERKTLATAFIEGFRSAADKTSFLRLAGNPLQPRRS